MPSFAKYQIKYIFRLTIYIFWSNLICASCSRWCKIPSRYNMFANFTSRSFTMAAPTFIWGIFALTKVSFKLLALRNPILGMSLNTLLCSLSGVKRRCILVIMIFNWARKGWTVILRTGLSSSSFLVRLLSRSALKSFLAFKIYFWTNLSLYPFPLSQISRSLIVYRKMNFRNKSCLALRLGYKVWIF